MAESLHWADQIVGELVERAKRDEVLGKIIEEKGYIVYDEKTPSGKIHIGSGRGWIIHDAIAKSLRDNGLKAKFVLSSDDIDPFDSFNSRNDWFSCLFCCGSYIFCNCPDCYCK